MDHAFILRAIMYGFTKPWNLVLRYELQMGSLRTWCDEISKKYLDNPYHNWYHAFDVYQYCHMCFNSGGGEFFNYQDIFSLLIASISHDVGHPGLTNPYLIA